MQEVIPARIASCRYLRITP